MNVSMLWKWARIAELLGILVLIVWAKVAAASSSRHIEVVRSKGTIWIMLPAEGTWQKLKAKIFEEGSLLRISQDSSLELKLSGAGLTSAEITARLRIHEPLIFRIDRQLFRKISYEDYALAGLWSEGAKEEKAIEVSPLLSFSSAFVRYFLSLETQEHLPKLKADLSEPSVEFGENAKSLEILSPSPDSFQELDRPRISMPIIWNSPNDELSYKIYLWPIHDVKRSPLATVKANRWQVTLDTPGSYNLQVISSDYQYRSKVIRVNVDRPLAFKVTEEPQADLFKKQDLKVDRHLQFTYPLDHFELNSLQAKPSVLFTWQDGIGLAAGEIYAFNIHGESNQDHLEIMTAMRFANINLNPGHYRYYIKKIRPTSTLSGQVSASQELRVVRRLVSAAWPLQWLRLQAPIFDSTVMIEDYR